MYLESTAGYYEMQRNAAITVSQQEGNIFHIQDNTNNLCGYHNGVLNQYYTLIECNPAVTGQFVQIQMYITFPLMLYEVEVWGI